jgi:hypothetical protein
VSVRFVSVCIVLCKSKKLTPIRKTEPLKRFKTKPFPGYPTPVSLSGCSNIQSSPWRCSCHPRRSPPHGSRLDHPLSFRTRLAVIRFQRRVPSGARGEPVFRLELAWRIGDAWRRTTGAGEGQRTSQIPISSVSGFSLCLIDHSDREKSFCRSFLMMNCPAEFLLRAE